MVVFAIYSHEPAMGVHVFPILTLPIPSLRVIPGYQPWAPYLMHQTWTYVIYFTYDNIHVSMLFFKSSHPCLLPQSPKVCSLHLCLFCYLAYRVIVAAAAAKLLQSCPTLWNPIDGSPPGSSVPWILKVRTLEWVTISFSNEWKWKWKWSRSVVSDS